MTTRDRNDLLLRFGNVEAKVDQLLEAVERLTKLNIALSDRITHIEDWKTRSMAYLKAITVAGGILTAVVAKFVIFTQRVLINVPVIPVK